MRSSSDQFQALNSSSWGWPTFLCPVMWSNCILTASTMFTLWQKGMSACSRAASSRWSGRKRERKKFAPRQIKSVFCWLHWRRCWHFSNGLILLHLSHGCLNDPEVVTAALGSPHSHHDSSWWRGQIRMHLSICLGSGGKDIFTVETPSLTVRNSSVRRSTALSRYSNHRVSRHNAPMYDSHLPSNFSLLNGSTAAVQSAGRPQQQQNVLPGQNEPHERGWRQQIAGGRWGWWRPWRGCGRWRERDKWGWWIILFLLHAVISRNGKLGNVETSVFA